MISGERGVSVAKLRVSGFGCGGSSGRGASGSGATMVFFKADFKGSCLSSSDSELESSGGRSLRSILTETLGCL